jgi:S-adenosylmethionine decarboxylase
MFFEGVEKRIELHFARSTPSQDGWCGLRGIDKASWANILSEAKCNILHQLSGEHVDAYLLSESSLFVWNDRIMLKTCGTTTPLHCVSPILEDANKRELHCTSLRYSHHTFLRPFDQPSPHQLWQDEITACKELCKKHGLEGETRTGTIETKGTKEPYLWFGWTSTRDGKECPKGMELACHDISSPIQSLCDKKHSLQDLFKGLLVPDCGELDLRVDEFWFDPQGYSANALIGDRYVTIHVTPQTLCSYISIESNVSASLFDNIKEKFHLSSYPSISLEL